MPQWLPLRFVLARLGFVFLAGPMAGWAAPTNAVAELDWRVAEGKVTARIEGWPLEKLLEHLAAKNRWQVFVDPAVRHTVSARFTDLPPGEALRRLLGRLNFVLVPATNAPARLYVFQTSVESATQRVAIPEAAGSRELKDELIVTLKPGSKDKLDDLAARLGARIIGRADDLNAYRLKFESEAAAQQARAELADDALVERVDSNYALDRPSDAELAGAALGSLSLRARPVAASDAVVVAMIDTAVQAEAVGIKEFLLPEISIAGKASPPPDELEHGTSMAATLLRGLSNTSDAREGTTVRILPVDVYGNRDSTTTFEIALGLQAAVNSGAAIVNLSLGGEDPSPLLREVIRAGREKGVVFLAAAGNEPVASPTYPAAYPEVVAVTALNRRGEIAAYANHGDFVDVGAPGTSYVSFWGQPYVVIGTSPATAYASSLAASIAATRGKRGAELEAEIRRQLAIGPGELAP